MTKHGEIINRVITEWANLLNIEPSFCYVDDWVRGDEHFCKLRFVPHVLRLRVEENRNYGKIEEKYIAEDIDKYFFQISLYLFAYKHHETTSIQSITDSGDCFYVSLNNGLAYCKHLAKMIETIGGNNQNGIYKLKKESLRTYYMFYCNNDKD